MQSYTRTPTAGVIGATFVGGVQRTAHAHGLATIWRTGPIAYGTSIYNRRSVCRIMDCSFIHKTFMDTVRIGSGGTPWVTLSSSNPEPSSEAGSCTLLTVNRSFATHSAIALLPKKPPSTSTRKFP